MFETVYLGITPTGWTNDDLPTVGEDIPFRQCVSEMALAGFQGCSIGHKYPTDPTQLSKELQLRGLVISEPWTSTYFTIEKDNGQQTEANFRKQMDFIKRVYGSAPVIADMVVAEMGGAVHQQMLEPISNSPTYTLQQWDRLIAGLKRLGDIAQQDGMKLCYHHHVGTGIQRYTEIETFLERTRDSAVNLLFDPGHLYYVEESEHPGQGQAMLEKLVEDHGDRIKHVHLKNIRQDVLLRAKAERWPFLHAMQNGIFTVPGDSAGVIRFEPLLQKLAAKQYQGWLIVEAEQDPRVAPLSSLEYAQIAARYLKPQIQRLSAQKVGSTR